MKYSSRKLIASYKTILVVLIFSNQITAQNQTTSTTPVDFKQETKDWLEGKVMGFTENKGQIADKDGNLVPQVLFKAAAKKGEMYITTSGITYVFSKVEGRETDNPLISSIALKMDLIGATIKKENVITKSALPGRNNYFLPHIPDGVMNAYTYRHITIKNIYPGIDWVLYTTKNNKGIKYDFVVHPGADPNNIKMKYIGAGKPVLEDEHTLNIETPFGNIREGNLITYNGISKNGINKKEITSSYQLNDRNEVSFNIANYNTQEKLIIDPPVVWGTFYGGNDEDFGFEITTSALGYILITGSTYSASTPFPVLNPGSGAYYDAFASTYDAFVVKLDSTGTLIWGTVYGGGYYDFGFGITTDVNENVYAVGQTQSDSDFPVDSGLDPGTYYQSVVEGHSIGSNGFILKFDSSGVRKWATEFGSWDDSKGVWTSTTGVAVFKDNLYVTGSTHNGITTMDEGGGAYIDSTIGGEYDGYFLKFDTTGVLKKSTFIGGSGKEYIGDKPAFFGSNMRVLYRGNNLEVDESGNVYITGLTSSTDFPTVNPAQAASGGGEDIFITKFNAAGAMEWSTYYGGSGNDKGIAITTDNTSVYITGVTSSTDFPLVDIGNGAYYQNILGNGGGGTMDAFVLKLDTAGTKKWSTYFGGNGNDVAFSIDIDNSNNCGNLFLTGYTTSTTNFDTLNPLDGSYFQGANAGLEDAFILLFSPIGVQKWATFSGGSNIDRGRSIHLSDAGDLFITGNTRSANFSPLVDMGGTAHYDTINDAANTWDDMIILKIADAGIASGGGSLTLGPDVGICSGNNITLKAAGGAIPYTWSTTGSTPADTLDSLTVNTAGIFWVSDSTSCGFSTDTIEVLANPILTLDIIALDTILCPAPANETVMLRVEGGISYLWSTGETTDTIFVASISTYTVVSDTISCAGKLADTITVIEDAGVTVNFGLPDSLCAGVAITLDAGNAGLTYLWSTGEISQTISVPAPDSYWGTATNINGCSASDTFNLIAKPTISISTEPICGSIMLSTAVNLGSAPVNYLWSNSETTANIEVTTSGVYQINVFDGFCVDSASVDITANTLEYFTDVILPNVFTPNDDGINDEFGVGSNDPFDEFSLKIYNRWGILLFEIDDVTQKWDGTDNNGDINEGVYFWIIHYKPTCFPHLEDTTTGTLNLLR